MSQLQKTAQWLHQAGVIFLPGEEMLGIQLTGLVEWHRLAAPSAFLLGHP